MDCHLPHRHDHSGTSCPPSLALLQLDFTTRSQRKTARNPQVPNENQVFPLPARTDDRSILLDRFHFVPRGYFLLSNDYLGYHSNDIASSALRLVLKRAHTLNPTEQIHPIRAGVHLYLSDCIVPTFNAKDFQLIHSQSPRVVPLFWTRVNCGRDIAT